MARAAVPDDAHAADAARSRGSDDEASSRSSEEDLRQRDVLEGTQTAVVLQALNDAVAEPSAFIQPSAQIADVARQATKALFDYSLSISGDAAGSAGSNNGQPPIVGGVPQLHVEGFDAEQIWGQLDMLAGPLLKRIKRLVARAGESPALLQPDAEARLDELRNADAGTSSSEEEKGAAEPGSGIENEAAVDAAGAESNGSDSSDSEGDAAQRRVRFADEGGEGNEAFASAASSRPRGKRKRLSVEDDFMKLDDMEAFVREAELDAMRDDDNADGASDQSDDESSEEDGEGGISDEDPENDSDAELAAVLDNANALVGCKRQQTRPAAEADGSESKEDDGMYASFFDPKPARGGGDGDGWREADFLDDEDASEDEGRGAGDSEWDGGQLFDTGEGREDAREGAREQLLGDSDADDSQKGGKEQMSKHERRTRAMQERIAAMEAAAMSEKDWFMRGETQAGQRPLNSALELDLDFDRTMKPPPAPTEEGTASLEDMIRARVAERQWDDVVRVAPPTAEKRKTALELDDKKSTKGLGEVYEEEYTKATAGANAVEEQDVMIKAEARTLLKELFAKLDALSHFHFAPKPVVEDMAVRAEVPALAMEEVAPQIASEASMRYPGEVYKPEGAPKGQDELSREERKHARAAKKRASKKHRAQKEGEKRNRSVAAGGAAPLADRKSEAAAKAANKEARNARKAGLRSEYTKSSKVFAKLQDQQVATASGRGAAKAQPGDGRPAALLKL